MHIRSEHWEKSTKIRMKHLFSHRSGTSPTGTASASQPPPPNPNPEPAITFLPPTPGTSTSGLHHLIPDDIADSEPNFSRATHSISLRGLFDFDNDYWVNLYDRYARNYLTEELTLCELLNQDSATDEGAEVNVDEMTGEILMG
jgi:hypothetical protein